MESVCSTFKLQKKLTVYRSLHQNAIKRPEGSNLPTSFRPLCLHVKKEQEWALRFISQRFSALGGEKRDIEVGQKSKATSRESVLRLRELVSNKRRNEGPDCLVNRSSFEGARLRRCLKATMKLRSEFTVCLFTKGAPLS